MADNPPEIVEPVIAKGFDRDVDFVDIKEKLLKKITSLYSKYMKEESEKIKRIIVNQICYCMIALLQLRNGSRISEACIAFVEYLKGKPTDEKIIVKIAKSEGNKYNWKTKKKQMTKPRYRKIMFPDDWIDLDLFMDIQESDPQILKIKQDRIRQRVRDYMLQYFNCNTHSLRYACINYLLYVEKRNMADVAKFVGHSSVNQLITYVQLKNTDQIFDLKI
jgi:integrase